MYAYPNYDRNEAWYYLCVNKTDLNDFVGNDDIDSFKIKDIRYSSIVDTVNPNVTFPMPNRTTVTYGILKIYHIYFCFLFFVFFRGLCLF